MNTSLKTLATQEGALTLAYQQQVGEAAHALRTAPRGMEKRLLLSALEQRLRKQAVVGRSVARKVLGRHDLTRSASPLPRDYYKSTGGFLSASLSWLAGEHLTIQNFTHLMKSKEPAVTVRWWQEERKSFATAVIPLEWLFLSDRAFAKVVRWELAHDREWRERSTLRYHYKRRLAYLEGEVGYLRNLVKKYGEEPAVTLPAMPMELR